MNIPSEEYPAAATNILPTDPEQKEQEVKKSRRADVAVHVLRNGVSRYVRTAAESVYFTHNLKHCKAVMQRTVVTLDHLVTFIDTGEITSSREEDKGTWREDLISSDVAQGTAALGGEKNTRMQTERIRQTVLDTMVAIASVITVIDSRSEPRRKKVKRVNEALKQYAEHLSKVSY